MWPRALAWSIFRAIHEKDGTLNVEVDPKAVCLVYSVNLEANIEKEAAKLEASTCFPVVLIPFERGKRVSITPDVTLSFHASNVDGVRDMKTMFKGMLFHGKDGDKRKHDGLAAYIKDWLYTSEQRNQQNNGTLTPISVKSTLIDEGSNVFDFEAASRSVKSGQEVNASKLAYAPNAEVPSVSGMPPTPPRLNGVPPPPPPPPPFLVGIPPHPKNNSFSLSDSITASKLRRPAATKGETDEQVTGEETAQSLMIKELRQRTEGAELISKREYLVEQLEVATAVQKTRPLNPPPIKTVGDALKAQEASEAAKEIDRLTQEINAIEDKLRKWHNKNRTTGSTPQTVVTQPYGQPTKGAPLPKPPLRVALEKFYGLMNPRNIPPSDVNVLLDDLLKTIETELEKEIDLERKRVRFDAAKKQVDSASAVVVAKEKIFAEACEQQISSPDKGILQATIADAKKLQEDLTKAKGDLEKARDALSKVELLIETKREEAKRRLDRCKKKSIEFIKEQNEKKTTDAEAKLLGALYSSLDAVREDSLNGGLPFKGRVVRRPIDVNEPNGQPDASGLPTPIGGLVLHSGLKAVP
jgi:hypothetical protein